MRLNRPEWLAAKLGSWAAVLFFLVCLQVFASNDYVILVDTSGSMQETVSKSDRRIRIRVVQDALRNFINGLRQNTRITLIWFNTGIAGEREFVLNAQSDREEIERCISRFENETKKNGQTYLWTSLDRALEKATQYAKEKPGQTVILQVLTDGEDNQRVTTLEKVVSRYPMVNKEIRGNIVLLGDLEIRVNVPGFEVRREPDMDLLFPPVIEWSPRLPKVGEEVSFYENSRSVYVDYVWRVDGQIVGSQGQKAIRYKFDKAGPHNVSLVVTGTKRTQAHHSEVVEVSPLPDPVKPPPLNPDFIYPSEVEPGQPVKFFGRCDGTPRSFRWRINGQDAGTGIDCQFTFPNEGNYEVVFIVTDIAGNETNKTRTVSVKEPQVRVAFTCVNEAMHEQEVQFVNESVGQIVSYNWDFGDGIKSDERNPKHRFKNTGTEPITNYVILQIATSSGKIFRSQPYPIKVLAKPATPVIPVPKADFIIVGEKFRVGSIVQFMNESSGLIDSYAWRFGDEGSSSEQNPRFRFNTHGPKMVQLDVHGPGGQSSTSKIVMIEKPQMSISLQWLDTRRTNACKEPKVIDFGKLSALHIRNQDYNRPSVDSFEVKFPAASDMPGDGGLEVAFMGNGGFELVEVSPVGGEPKPVNGMIQKSGRFRIRINPMASGSNSLNGKMLIQAHGKDLLLNNQTSPVIIPIKLSTSHGGSVWPLLLGVLVVGVVLAYYLLRPATLPNNQLMSVVLTEKLVNEADSQKNPLSSTFDLCPSERIALGRDPNSPVVLEKLFDLNSPDAYLMRQQSGLELRSLKGDFKARKLSRQDEFEITDLNNKKRLVAVKWEGKVSSPVQGTQQRRH